LATKPNIKPEPVPHPSIPKVVNVPTWRRAMWIMRSCWNYERRVTGPWVSPFTGQCLCPGCLRNTHAPKPSPRGRGRQGVRAWRR
jgi:hypothetical protein